ncbi:LuxR family transcriptional regulator [Mycobacterium sp. 3519A]|uniref:LuxR family transcriptional regulator n=1 Tax=Mycobacterium sp. 3519A TaxID=2057184 RepID=UPI000C7E62DD|nr:LuxR family transcriptional regulator [Mycobacterium sp. 3519A]
MFPGVRDRIVASVSETDWSDLDVTELLPTGTVTLMLADVEGSTQLWESQPSAMTAAVEQLNRTASQLIAEHGGVRPVEQGEGDSFVAAFARASDAVACALELQRSPLAPIKLRIGLHTGEVQLRDEGNYAGSTINKTARLRDLAHGGQTVLSSATQELVEDRLPADAWLTDVGSHPLRDLPRPMHVAQLCHPDVCNDFPPLRSAKATVRQHLPRQLTTFVGRAPQVAEIRSIVVENRLVTLTGAGGAGKTRLAIEVAAQLTEAFPDGVCYADLAPLTHAEVVPLTVARTLGLPDQPGRSITETVLRSIRDRRMLIMLDNCEHLLAACAGLANDLLAGCPNLAVFATSREPLMVAGEVNWQVPSLSLDSEAIELFADRARRARPDFSVTETNRAVVTEICRRLDGMPLAIELAAARVRALSLEEIVDSLHDRFRLLTGGARTAVRRQQTLRASVDWSHALLTEPERVMFRRLSVFMGGFTLDAAQAVAGATEVERFQVLDQLSLLVDKSLVVAESASGRTRYRLLETVRQYALEKLGESGEADAVRSRHRDHYQAVAKALDAPATSGHQQRIAHALVEMDNLRAAYTWSYENSEMTEALELASFLQPLWLQQGRIREGLAWIDAVLEDEAAANSASPTARVRGFADKALLDSWYGSLHSPNIERVDEALTTARDIGDHALLIRALVARGCVVLYDAEAAAPYFVEAAELAGDCGDLWRLSQVLERQSYRALFVTGDLQGVLTASEGRELARRIGDRLTTNAWGIYIAGARLFVGDPAGALAEARAVKREARDTRDLLSEMTGLMSESIILSFLGDAVGAGSAIAASCQGAPEIGEYFESACLPNIALAHLAAGDVAAAWDACQEALPTITNLYNSVNAFWLAFAALGAGESTTALGLVDTVLTTAKGCWISVALVIRGRIKMAFGDSRLAEADLHAGLASAADTDAKLHIPDALEWLAQLASGADRNHEACRLLGAADALRTSMGSVRLPIFDADHDATVASLRNALGNNDFDAAWAEGAAMSTDEAIAYALRGRGERKRPSSGWDSLTPTELDVVRLVGEGLPNKDIAARLFVSPRTVQSHLRHVYNKVGLTSRVQLAQEAVRRTEPPVAYRG